MESDLMSDWIEITDDPDTRPEACELVIIHESGGNGSELFGWRDGCRWYQSELVYWSSNTQSIEPESRKECSPPSHWRSV
jgi:hypothetical protein